MNRLTAPGKRLFLSGDEAVARAALEAGVHVATGYPGNPGGGALAALIPLARRYDLVAEWSVNEKVALEVATGAAWAGRKSLVTMKMSGLNVLADSLLSIAHSGVNGALVIYAVDDVGVFYGMVEQDSRYYALLASLPLLMPANPEEAYMMTLLAFQVSALTGAPVMLLGTTAVAAAQSWIQVAPLDRPAGEAAADFRRDLARFTKAVPQWCREQHAAALARLQQAGSLLNAANRREEPGAAWATASLSQPRRIGVVVAGVSAGYLAELRLRLRTAPPLAVFKLGVVNPLPLEELRDFLAPLEAVLVLEELEPLIETQIAALLAEHGLQLRLLGKRNGLLPRVGEYDLALVARALAALLAAAEYHEAASEALTLADQMTQASALLSTIAPASPMSLAPLARTLEFCPGCPHRMTYYALRRALQAAGYQPDEIITTGDIGCTILGMHAPLSVCWTEVSMGASIGIAQGLKYAGLERPVVAAMGDSTFFHGGIAGLLNAVQSGVRLTLLLLDNGLTAMTGQQPNPGSWHDSTGRPAGPRADIETIVRGCGVTFVRTVNPYDLEATVTALREALNCSGVAVVIARAPCTIPGRLLPDHTAPFQVDETRCCAGRGCQELPCYYQVGCPAVVLTSASAEEDAEKQLTAEHGPRVHIDPLSCVACGLCAAACPFDAIRPQESLTRAESETKALATAWPSLLVQE
ncbi:indolepyruvate ferredoxin oxidoreductase subunit alpha [Thermogemmatispora sp.]|uniref:indolepyruvate ferredoxin oxidoreductase subunit alpha n=1 Tax=Thermogemmatispora sp. TaxID=1968838 RepID=UPI001D788D94|nr:indolepyruvate ferredoxin oxidoreductase subunit alpha [Thermogemmatispora sp.]MBX5450315.1 indolepyruvate ferredoxin oxidoreductase subunit alpha [Thermogemmatispora sp.]